MEEYGVCTSRSVRTVSLVVTAVDDFTGRVITGSNVRVWIDGAKPPIKKQDGYHVFMNLPAGMHTVHAEGGFYNRCSFTCRVEEGTYTNLKLRMTPGRNAPLEAGTAVIEGSAPSGSRVRIRAAERQLAYKLLTDVKAGDTKAAIYHPDGADIEGKLLCICAQSGEETYIRVLRCTDTGRAEYLLDGSMPCDFQKIGTLVFPVSESMADSRGRFFVPLRSVPEKACAFICMTESASKEFTLSAGSRVRLAFEALE